MPNVRSIEQFRDALALLPDGAMLPARELREWLRDVPPTPAQAQADAATWLEKIWTCTPETLLNTRQAAEALGQSPNWLRKRLAEIPHVRFGSENKFPAGELRRWMTQQEQIVRLATTELRLHRALRGGRAT